MNVIEIKINSVAVPFTEQPKGLERTKFKLDRDGIYNGIVVTLDTELEFDCKSAKEAIDTEYLTNYMDGTGEITLEEVCGSNVIQSKYALDFTKYSKRSYSTTVGLKEINPTNSFKESETNLITIPKSLLKDVYVRNLPIEYKYYSQKWSSAETDDSGLIIDIVQVGSPTARPEKLVALFPKSYTELNELENGNKLNAETITWMEVTSNSSNICFGEYIDPSGATIAPPSFDYFTVSEVEPTPVFENELEDGEITITTAGSTALVIDFLGSTKNVTFNLMEFKECIAIGNKFDVTFGYHNQFNYTPSNNIASISTQINYTNPTYPTKSLTRTLPIKKGQKVWIWYEMRHGNYITSIGAYIFQFDKYSTTINRTLDIKYTTLKNVTTSNITSNALLEAYSTKVKAFHIKDVFETLFGAGTANMFTLTAHKDLYITNGEYMRGKTTPKEFQLSRRDLFEELEKLKCVGLGAHVISGAYQLKVTPIDKLYNSSIGKVFDTSIDDINSIEIETYENLSYNKVEIGFKNAKDTKEEIHSNNSYNITEQTKVSRTYTKICDWITSKYLIKKSLTLGTDDKELEFDKNIFVLSCKDNGTNHIHTLSQSSSSGSLGFDDVYETNSTQNLGMNRLYSTAFVVKAHLLKWVGGLWKTKTNLVNTEQSTKTVKLTTGGVVIPAKASLTHTQLSANRNIIPQTISFNVVLSTKDAWDLRAVQYQTFKLIDGSDIYHGFLFGLNYDNGVAKIKLLGIKNP